MLGSHNDKGARCSRHYGEVFLPRCPACESLNNEYAALHIESPTNAP